MSRNLSPTRQSIGEELAESGIGFHWFFAEAGVETYRYFEASNDYWLVNGRKVRATPGRRESWGDMLDRAVAIALPGWLAASVAKRFPSGKLNLKAQASSRKVIFSAAGTRVVEIHPYGAWLVAESEWVYGNFLIAGEHWDRLIAVISPDVQALATLLLPRGGGSAGDGHPAEIPRELRRRALVASRELRTARTIAYGHAVLLLGTQVELLIERLRWRGRRLEAPFVYRARSGVLAGALLLDSYSDPLECVQFSGQGDTGRGWATALIGLASLVCVTHHEHRMSGRRPPRASASGARGLIGSPRAEVADPRALEARRFERGLIHGPQLTPTAETARVGASYVVGHTRHLAGGEASERALRNAELHGIRPAPGGTWVQPHARGLPKDALLTFHWDDGAEADAPTKSR